MPEASRYWQLRQGDPYGSVNCAAYAAAAAIAFETCGNQTPTGAAVRHATNEPTPSPKDPGLTQRQIVDAAAKWGVELEHDLVPWAEFTDRLREGHSAVVAVVYTPIRDNPTYRGSETFGQGHSIAVFPGLWVIDPLADGRRPGIATGPQVYPDALLLRAAGLWAGVGMVDAAFTPTPHPIVVPPKVVLHGGEALSRGWYRVTKGANVHTAPVAYDRDGSIAHNVVGSVRRGQRVYVYERQQQGQRVAGDRRWYCIGAQRPRWIRAAVVEEV